MNNNEIVSKLKVLVLEERKITSDILKYLREVETRKIFAYLGYSSLFEFCRKELNYSEGAAQRRISAMRLIRELPHVEEKIVSGALSLSVASQAQTFFKRKSKLKKPMANKEKLNLLTSLENISSRECEKALVQLEPAMAIKDKERYVGPKAIEIKITVDEEFIQNVETLKNHLSHKMPLATTKDILAHALKSLLEKSTTDKRACLKEKLGKKENLGEIGKLEKMKILEQMEISDQKGNLNSQSTDLLPTSALIRPNLAEEVRSPMSDYTKPKSRYISARSRRIVWQRAANQCQFKSPATGRRCESKKFLEIDHIIPKILAGSNEVDNLQLLCDTHNRLKGGELLI